MTGAALVMTAGRLLAQHEEHDMRAAGASSPRFDFSITALYADHGSLHGDRKLGLRDWEHLERPGRITLRAMTSLGALLDREGMPQLLQTGGTYRHGYTHDRQHADDVLMEAAAEARVGPAFIYVAPVGAPALGPAPWMHRASSAFDPTAPVGHHWQDATHVSYGVVTLGAKWRGATAEASAFNARESDYKSPWPDFSHGRLDSFSGRVGWDARGFVLRGWWGYLKSHDPIAPGMQMHRYGASTGFTRGRVASLAVWGMNVHHHDGSSHALLHGDPNSSPHVRSSSVLVESTFRAGSRTAVFGRAERVMKNGEELGFFGGDLMALHEVRTVALGAHRSLWTSRYAAIAAGARGSISFLGATLSSAYGTRRPMGVELFVQLRPALP